jgi:hypothetical protein
MVIYRFIEYVEDAFLLAQAMPTRALTGNCTSGALLPPLMEKRS